LKDRHVKITGARIRFRFRDLPHLLHPSGDPGGIPRCGKLALWKRTSAAANERSRLSQHEVALIRYLEVVAG